MLRLITRIVAFGCCVPAWADSTVAPATAPATELASRIPAAGMGAQLAQLSLGLLLVIGLIFVLAWLARRLQQRLPAGNHNDSIRLLASRPLGPRERLVLVQVGNEQVLLGLTPGSIEALHVLQEPVDIEAQQPQTVGEFARRLKQVLRQSDTQDKES